MIRKLLSPDYYMPALVAALLTIGGNGYKWYTETTDVVKAHKNTQARLSALESKVDANTSKLERLLGFFEGRERVTVTVTPNDK